MSASLDAVEPDLANGIRALDLEVHSAGLQGRITSTLRTHAEQKKLYERYLRGGSEFPAAPPGKSAHEFGYAVDYLVSPYEYQGDVGDLWKQWGGLWHASDAVHFELPGFKAPSSPADVGIYPSVGEWIKEMLGAIPWWISYFLPLGLTVDDAANPATQKRLVKILNSTNF